MRGFNGKALFGVMRLRMSLVLRIRVVAEIMIVPAVMDMMTGSATAGVAMMLNVAMGRIMVPGIFMMRLMHGLRKRLWNVRSSASRGLPCLIRCISIQRNSEAL